MRFYEKCAERLSQIVEFIKAMNASEDESQSLKESIIAEVEEIKREINEFYNEPDSDLNIKFDEIKELPTELLDELSISKSQDLIILDIINGNGGRASLDQIIIGLYKKTGQIHKRVKTNSVLYRMTTRGLLIGEEGRKGVYKIKEN